MSNINFFNEGIDFSLDHPTEVSNWVSNIVKEYSYELLEINYIFCSDEYLHQINVDYLNHDTYTDIITFDNSEEADKLESDIFISIDRVMENSKEYSKSFNKELYRVMIHGVLHLLGFHDQTDEQKKEMREKEEACLSLLKING